MHQSLTILPRLSGGNSAQEVLYVKRLVLSAKTSCMSGADNYTSDLDCAARDRVKTMRWS